MYAEALPTGFSFYDLGEVTSDAKGSALPDDLSNLHQSKALDQFLAIGFRLITETNTWVVTLFDSQLDSNIYSELGNILASQFASRLQQLEDSMEPILISPPMKLSTPLLTRWLEARPSLLARTYWHRFEDRSVAVHALVLSGEQGGTA
jgi:hypothetical protein